MVEKLADIVCWMADKDVVTTEAIVAEFGFAETTAKRYLRQLTEFDYLST